MFSVDHSHHALVSEHEIRALKTEVESAFQMAWVLNSISCCHIISSSAVVEHTVFINMAELAHATMKCDNNLWRRINVNVP